MKLHEVEDDIREGSEIIECARGPLPKSWQNRPMAIEVRRSPYSL